jgi:hypothetical protein
MRKREIMPEKKFKSVAEIDEELEKLYKEATEKEASASTESEETDETVEAEPEELTTDTEQEKNQSETLPVKKDEPIVLEPVQKEDKTRKEDKANYAFKQLREEAEKATKELNLKNQLVSEFEIIAKSQGFSNVDSFLDAWKEKQLETEAQRRGIDPKILKELEQTKQRLNEIEKEKNEAVKQTQFTKVNNVISKFASSNKLSSQEMDRIIETMGTDNVTPEMLISAPAETLEKMLTGYAQEILIEKKVQERLAKMETEDTPKSEKHKNTVTSKKPDPFSKEALDDEMEAFKKANYPWLK